MASINDPTQISKIEKRKTLAKQYYQANKQTILKRLLNPTECAICKINVCKAAMPNHIRSSKHKTNERIAALEIQIGSLTILPPPVFVEPDNADLINEFSTGCDTPVQNISSVTP